MAVCISCSAKTNQPTMSNHKAIVVFFSHAGENYSVGNIKVGNTKIVADYISELIGADQAEIVTHKYDGMAYTPLTNLAQDEQNNDERPDFELVPEVDFSQYDTIFIGGPVWWGTYPQVMFTFFDRYDLNGKTIYPFTTHEGSGLPRVPERLRAERLLHLWSRGAYQQSKSRELAQRTVVKIIKSL